MCINTLRRGTWKTVVKVVYRIPSPNEQRTPGPFPPFGKGTDEVGAEGGDGRGGIVCKVEIP